MSSMEILEKKERTSEAMELLDIVIKLNQEFNELDETEDGVGISNPFELFACGGFFEECCIEFLGNQIWTSETDGRKYTDEDSEEYTETIEEFVRRRAIGHMRMLGRIAVVFDKKEGKQ
jgi:hypothetical protein